MGVSSTVLSLNIRPRNRNRSDTSENISKLLFIFDVGVSLLCLHADTEMFPKVQIVNASCHVAPVL